MTYHNTIKNLPIKCHSMFLRPKGGCLNIKKIWDEAESQLFEKMATEPIKGDGKYVRGS